MSDQVVTVTVKGVGDFSDVVSNVGSVQKALTKLKLPDKLGDNLNKNITAFYKEYEKYQQKIAGGLKTQGDYNQVEKSLNTMRNLYQAIGADAQKLLKLDMKDLLKLDTGEFKKISDDITNIMKEIGSFKIDMSPFTKAAAEIRNVTKNSKISGDSGLLNQIIGSINTGQIAEAKKQLQELQNYANKVAPRTTASGERMPGTLSLEKYQQLTNAIGIMTGAVGQAEAAMNPLIQRQNDLQRELEETKQKAASGIEKEFKGYNEASKDVERVTDSLKRMHEEEFSFNREAQNIDRQIQSYFGLSQMIRKVGDIAKDAFATVKELDKAMTQTAVVTNFSVGDMWDMLPTYTAQANQLGSTIKDVYEAATLYYQQGLNTNQAMGLANETLKMARIAGLGAADATNMMTAALRGFNMEINQQSAQNINDIYSELAAITASDTKEIGSAMERTASIANSANMEFATTSALLAQMIETTREAPENLGTAMKTIVARFQEMKQDPTKLIDSEGVAMDANKVDKALKTIGVQLMNTKGEFRDLDDVFLDISQRWDSLTQGQQRYIATIAAGSRQQSRFIAMMSNYERTMELVDAANNSAGASQRQFEKTLDSMEAKLNKLKNAWDQFTMGLMNNQILKFGVDALTEGFTIVNKFIDILGKIPPKPFEGITKSVLTLVTTLGMLQLGKKASRGLVMGGAAWWKGEEGGFGKNFMSGFSGQAAKAGTADGQAYAQNFSNALKKGQLKEAFNLTQSRAKMLDGTTEYENTFQAAFGQFSAKELSAGWSPQIEAEIRDAFQRATANVDLTQYGIQDGDEYLSGLLSRLSQGEASALEESNILKLKTGGKVDLSSMGVNPIPVKEVDKLGNSLTKAGASLQTFGMALQDTPLAPFGALLSKIGMLTNGFGEAVGKAFTIFKDGMAGTAVAEAEVGAGATAMAAGEATATAATGGLIGGIQALWGALLESPLFPIIAVLAGLVVAYKLLDAAIVTDKEKLESASDAAAAASEAYDSAKQETSELADSIAQIEETDSAFDNLVAGTAEFNEQLVTANEQILALIDKYPMLMESGYVSTDKNGLMHISDEGFKAVKEYQKQIQANASAMNLIQTADLNAEENRQKADKLRAQRGALTLDEVKKNERNADLLEQRAKAEVDLARSNAIRTALSGKELRDTEALTAVYTGLYEEKRKAAEIDVNALDEHDIMQKYADYHGYTYDKSTKKIKDVEGNEIDYDDAAIKDEVIEQTVLLDFEENASSLEGVLNKLDNAFNKTLENSFEGSSHFLTDILSSNIETNTDLLEQVLESPKELQEVVNNLSAKEVEAILGLSAGTVSDVNFDKYKNDVVNLLLDRANNIADAQAQSYSQLAAMLAQSKGWTTSETTNIIGNKEMIQSMLRDLTVQQANTLSSIGQTLQESVGSEAMATFIRDASNIYLRESQDVIDRFDNIINNVNWDSAASRLEGYHKAINSTDESIQKWGKDMRASADEANILGDAFDEFLGGDWAELSEKADDFKNAMGEIDGAGILKAAEQSKTLKSLLDSGEVSATGVAMALQGIEEGKYSIGAVDTTVLQLLSSLNRLADAAYEAHNIIEKFDAGIDTGEGEDFVKENAEKAIEYYDNGEFGNQQLQNYIKLAAGEERWNEAIKNRHGDLQLVEKDLMSYVKTFKDGFQPAWDQMVAGKGINGQSLAKNISDAVDSNKISKELGDKFKEVKTFWDDEGYLNVDFGELSTSELEKYYEAAYGVSEEYAKLLVQDLANYDATVSSMLAKNDLKETVQSESFQREHMIDGQMILSDAQIQAFEAAGGSMEELARAAGVTAEELEKNQFHVLDENGNRIDNTNDPKLLQDYIKTFEKAEKGSIQSLFETGSKELFTNNKLDLNKLIADTQSKGFDQEQAMQAAWQAYQRGEQLGQRTTAGETELKQGMQTYEEFVNEMNSSLETDKWVHIGEAIAQGAMNFFNKQEAQEQEAQGSENKTDLSSKEPQTPQKPAGMPQSDWEAQQRSGQVVEKQPLQKLWDLIVKAPQEEAKARAEQNAANANPTADDVRARNKQWWSNFFSEGDQAAAARNQKITGGQENTSQQSTDDAQTKEATTVSTEITAAAQSLTTAGDGLNTAITNLTSAGKTLNTAGQNLTNAANTINQNNGKNNGINASASVPTINTGTNVVANIAQQAVQNTQSQMNIEVKGTEKLDEAKTKGSEAAAVINKGASFVVKTPGAGKLKKAADSAKKISDSAGSKSISLSTSVSGSSAKDIDTVKKSVSNFEKLNKSHSIKLKTSLTGASASSIDTVISAINRFHQKTDHTVTLKTIKKTENNSNDDATGAHNHGYAPALPSVGSAARGSYGQLGPKGKGGMTLTGELGYEIAWIPSENRSMILGANGPQMVNLPGDAVVWTHEQSKKIMKQKSIPAGSHARTGRQNQSQTTTATTSGGSTTRHKTTKKTKKSETREVITAGKISSKIFNLEQKIAEVKIKQEKAQKALNKQLAIAYNTMANIQKSGNEDIKRLKQSAKWNKNLVDIYNNQLKKLERSGDGKTKIEWTNPTEKRTKKKGKWGKWKKDSTKKHTASIDLGNYIYYDKDTDAYLVDYDKINKTFGSDKNKAKAVKEAAEKQISDKISKRDSAQKDLDDANEKLEELGKTLYENFYSWKNELTEILEITKQIENAQKRTELFKSMLDLDEVMTSNFMSLGNSLQYFQAQINSTITEIDTRADAINMQRESVLRAISNSEERKELNAVKARINKGGLSETELAAMEARKQELEEQLKIQEAAQKYVFAKINADGTTDVNINENQLNADRDAGNISKELYEGIKNYYDTIIEENNNLIGLYEDQVSAFANLQESLRGLKEDYADKSEKLLEAAEESAEDEIEQFEKLNSSLTEALKELLDGVKEKLDERRNKEDNEKTERDISKQQQRLAMLRADTSGGHQVEIAQLERDIADSQQSYQRTLEDQLLDRMQAQADKAEKQRERQIALMNSQLEIAKTTNSFVDLINQYLADPERYATQIEALWKKSEGYENRTDARKSVLDGELASFQKALNKETGLPAQIDLTNTAIKNTATKLKLLQEAISNTAKEINDNGVNFANGGGSNAGSSSNGGSKTYTLNKGVNTRAAINDLKERGADNSQIKDALKTAYGSGATAVKNLVANQYSTSEIKSFTDSNQRKEYYKSVLNDAQSNKKTSLAEIEKIQTAASMAGYGARTFLYDFAKTEGITWEQILKVLKGKWSKYRLALSFNNKSFKAAYNKVFSSDAVKNKQGKVTKTAYEHNLDIAKNKKYKPYAYESGGLATQTGPAWLDGTPSKPELVLNAQDTKNFMALKDVLSHAVGTTNQVENSYGGNAIYEININVDHLNNDYDVDRVVERVKKKIVQGSGYRNVTQVRKFR